MVVEGNDSALAQKCVLGVIDRLPEAAGYASATLDAGAVSLFRYDGDGQRTLTLHGSITTTYFLRGLGQVLSEFEEGGSQLR